MTMVMKAGISVAIALLLAGCAKAPPVASAPPPPPVAAPPPVMAPSRPAPAAPSYVIASGTASALERYAKGSTVRLSDQICLRTGETVTLVNRASGRRVTYGGPGCNKTVANPEATQSGATTIGAFNRAEGPHDASAR